MLVNNHLKNEIRNVLSGKSKVRFGATIQTIASYISNGAQTSAIIEREEQSKSKEAKKLEEYISENNLWVSIDFTQYVSEGA